MDENCKTIKKSLNYIGRVALKSKKSLANKTPPVSTCPSTPLRAHGSPKKFILPTSLRLS
jgi:hypothetical protein